MVKVTVVKREPLAPPPKALVPFVPGGVYTEHGSVYIMIYENDLNGNCVRYGHRYALAAPAQGGSMATEWMIKRDMIEHLNKSTNAYVYRMDAELKITFEPHEQGI